MVLECDAVPREPRLGERIDAVLGIAPPAYRAVLGSVDVLLDARGVLSSFELRTNPALWQRALLVPLPQDIDAVSLRFDAAFDENDIVSWDIDVAVGIDPDARQLSLTFGGYRAHRWGSVGDGLLAGATADGYLSELRVLDLPSAFK